MTLPGVVGREGERLPKRRRADHRESLSGTLRLSKDPTASPAESSEQGSPFPAAKLGERVSVGQKVEHLEMRQVRKPDLSERAALLDRRDSQARIAWMKDVL